jgi:hypothetical protein
VPLDIPTCFPHTPKCDIKTIAFHNRYLSYWIQLSYDGNVDGIRTLNDNSAVQHAFRGPVVALAYDAEEGLSKPALDVDTGTLNPVLEYARLRAEYAGICRATTGRVRGTGMDGFHENWSRRLRCCG